MSYQQWVWDQVDSYDLDQRDLERYLRRLFGNYNFFTKRTRLPEQLLATPSMQQFLESWDAAATYPASLARHDTYLYNLEGYVKRLDCREKDLFSTESRARLDFWDFDKVAQEFKPACVSSADGLKKKICAGDRPARKDPQCRFLFVHAPSSRAQLRITREMLMLSLTYHQVMPAYLDFLFPLGRQVYQRDFHFSGFQHENHLTACEQGLRIPELGRSGRDLQLCYSLKSVEPSESNPSRPWSIRQTAIYHSFDIETGAATWILTKGNELMKDRVQLATGPHRLHPPELTSFETVAAAITASLATHLIFCSWSGENWRWYINFLEEELQDKTRRVLLPTGDTPTSPISEKTLTEEPGLMTPPMLPSSQPFPPSPRENSYRPSGRRGMSDQQDFSFSQLQRVQSIEDKANETLLVLKANISVLTELEDCYRHIFDCDNRPKELAAYCKDDYVRFESRITSIRNDLRMQQSRVETLLHLLDDRKSLLYGILEYRCMEASKELAQKAQQSAKNMEKITQDMHNIARKTKQETVSMRIITLVTLFFLPGTFISLGQTLMSTDIIKFQDKSAGKPGRTFQPGALQLYLAISLPLMFITFLSWYGVYWWVNRKDRRKSSKLGVFRSPV
ncbi:MAG: hypothetical protein M1839_002075 [Geoglossum umbratile]|nr:MAG: hypothetical protein M1839_002075 [Geoglossum umbratile]